MTLEELIAALEKATGPDRGLDLQIMRVGFKHQVLKWEEAGWDEDGKDFPDGIRYWTDEREKSYAVGVERYTSSLDAALTLVPEGCRYVVGTMKHKGRGIGAFAVVKAHPSDHPYEADHETPALALCIAALKARATSPTTGSTTNE